MELIAKWYPKGIASKNKEDAARRDEQISELLSDVHDDAARVYDLLQLQDYEVVDHNDFYFELRSLLTEALDQVDQTGNFLLEAALSQETAWYVRRQTVYLLKARRKPNLMLELLPLLEEHGLQGEIRAVVATTLGHYQLEEARPVLLNLYRALRKGDDPRLGGWTYAEADLLEALGSLGERDTLRPLIALQYHTYKSRRMSGQRGLQQLITHLGGLPETLTLLDDRTDEALETRLARLATSDPAEAVRRWAIEQLVEVAGGSAAQVLCDRLSDSAWMVANAAAQSLIELAERPVAHLSAIVENSSLTSTNRLWAAYVLLKSNQPVSEDQLKAIPDYPHSLPEIITPELRKVIVQCWVPNCEAGTDVRWLVEGQTLPALEPYTPPFAQLQTALQQHGLNTSGPLYCSELYMQGRGTFWVLQSRTAYEKKLYFYTLYLSMLGPFAYLSVLANEDDTANSAEIPFNDSTPEDTRRLYRQAVEATGLTMLDNQVANYVFPDLNIYYFGNREALSVNDLLYYWQD